MSDREELGVINIVDTRDEEDESCTIEFTLDEETKTKMAVIGVRFVLYCAAAGTDVEEAFYNIVKDLLKESEDDRTPPQTMPL